MNESRKREPVRKTYDAFISYARDPDLGIARALWEGLVRLGKPWYRLRALNVFLDTTSLPVGSALSSELKASLSQSRYLVLLASEEAADSEWVSREIEYWLGQGSQQRLLIVLTNGAIHWDDERGEFDWSRSTALPGVLAGVFKDEPVYLDLRWTRDKDRLNLENERFRDAVASLSAPLRGFESEEQVINEEAIQRRRLRRVFAAAAVCFLVLSLAYVRLHMVGERERKLSIVQALTIEAPLQRSRDLQDERAALLAREAFLLNQELDGGFLSQIDRSLRLVLGNPYFASVLSGHQKNVNSVAFSPDGTTLASGSDDRTIRLWSVDRPTRGPLVLEGHEAEVRTVAYSPDGALLASGSEDATLRFWDLANPTAKPHVLDGPGSEVLSLAISPDGNSLVAGTLNGTVLLYDLKNLNDRPIVLGSHLHFVTSVAFAPDSKRVASGSRDHRINIWDLEDPRAPPLSLLEQDAIVRSVAFSPTGGYLASGNDDGTLYLWDLRDPRPGPAVLRGHESSVYSLAFSPDGKVLASGGLDQRIRLWDTERLSAEAPSLRVDQGLISSVAFSPDGRYLASGSYDRNVRIWDLRTSPVLALDLEGHVAQVSALDFSPDGTLLATGSLDKTVRLWDLERPTSEPRVLPGESVEAVELEPAGRFLAVGGSSGIRIWDWQRPAEPPRVIWEQESGVSSIAIGPAGHGQRLAWGSYDGHIRVLRLGEPPLSPAILPGDGVGVSIIAMSPDGETLASARGSRFARLFRSPDHDIAIWDLDDLSASPVLLRGHELDIYCLAISPDGKKLASGSRDRTILLWDLENMRSAPLTLARLDAEVSALAFSPDGRILAGATYDDGTVRLWNLRRPDDAPVQLEGHDENIFALAFGPEGRRLASGDWGGRVRIWFVDTEALAESVCSKVRRNLTRAEWSLLIGDSLPYRRTCSGLPGDPG